VEIFYYLVLTSFFFRCWDSNDYESNHCDVMGRAKRMEDPLLKFFMEKLMKAE